MSREPSEDRAEPEVLAAGGVVVREAADGVRVAVVRRPRYDDWSLPKGKLDEGEGWKEAALREVEEEVGSACELGAELPAVAYIDNKGRYKVVRYWLMEAVGDDDFEPNDEVDEVRWLAAGEALALLSYERDQSLLEEALEVLA